MKNKFFKTFFVFITIIGFASCVTKKTVENLRPVYITNSKKIHLLSTKNFNQIIDQIQLLTGNFGAQSFSLMSYTQIDATGINLSLFNDFGADMGTVSYNDVSVLFDSAYFPKTLPGEYIICDIQNAYYDVYALENNYKAAGLLFSQKKSFENGKMLEIRKIQDDQKLIEEITIFDNTVTIKNYLRGYEYKLQKIEE